MTDLLNQIKKDQLQARKEKDVVKKNILTTLLGEASPSGSETTNDEKVRGVIEKFSKNLKETIGHYDNQGKDTSEAKQELEILRTYLPESLTEETMEEIAKSFIDENGIESKKQMGMVMKHFKENYSGQYDGSELSKIVSKLIS